MQRHAAEALNKQEQAGNPPLYPVPTPTPTPNLTPIRTCNPTRNPSRTLTLAALSTIKLKEPYSLLATEREPQPFRAPITDVMIMLNL